MPAKSLILNFHDIPTICHSYENKYTISLDNLKSIIKLSKRSGVPVSYTFDDGYKSHFSNVIKLLDELKVTGHFFINTSNLNQAGFLTVKDILEIQKLGHKINLHGHTHQSFTKMTEQELVANLTEGKQILEGLLEKKCTQLAFPFGHYNNQVLSTCRQLGFTKFYSTTFKKNAKNSELMGRINIRNDFSLRYIEKLLTSQFPYFHIRKTLSKLKNRIT